MRRLRAAGNGYTTVRGWWLPSVEAAAAAGEARRGAGRRRWPAPLAGAASVDGEAGSAPGGGGCLEDQEAAVSLLLGIKEGAAPVKGEPPTPPPPLPTSFPLVLPMTMPGGSGSTT
jgi:hypothetical protein